MVWASVRVGGCGSAPDPSLTGNGGLIAVTELLDRLDIIGLLDVAVGPIKQRDRGFGAGELLVGMASAQLAGQDFLVGLDRVRADTAGQALSPVPGFGFDHRDRVGAPLHRRAVAGGGIGGGRGDRADAHAAAAGAGRGVDLRSGDHGHGGERR